MLRIILSFIFSLSIVFSQNTSEIRKLINAGQSSEKLSQSQWSLSARYVESGRKIINYNSQQNLAPASGLKLVTTAAALDILGENYKFNTSVYYDGEINSNGILNGNIFIRGGSDPTLGSDLAEGSLPLDSLMIFITSKISEAGIKKINGSVIADPNRFQGMNLPRRWIWEDIGNYYGAQTSGLCINDNLYHIYFEPNKNINGKAKFLRTEPVIPDLKFINNMLTGSKNSGDNGYVFCPPNYYIAELKGSIPQGKPEFKIKGSIPNPPLFAVQYLKTHLEKKGIFVEGDTFVSQKPVSYVSKNEICNIVSPPVKEIVYIINKKSYNLYTEQILREMGFRVFGKATTENGIEAVKQFLKRNGIDTEYFNIFDGSGLSRSNIVTTSLMTDLLIAVSKKSYFESFYNSLGVAGKTDDLSSFKYFGIGTKIEKNARIKSGYMTGVRSHSGYVTDSKGRLIAFSFIANNFLGSTSFISKKHREILIELAKMK